MVKRLTKKGSGSLNDDFAEACVKKCLSGSPFDNLNERFMSRNVEETEQI